MFEIDLHKKRIKSIVRIIFEIIFHFYSNENLKQIVEKSKEKTKIISVVKDISQNFSFDWVVNLFLITAAIKEFPHQTKNFRDSSTYKTFLQKNSKSSSSSSALNESENLIVKKSKALFSSKHILLKTKNISLRALLLDQRKKLDKFKKQQILSSQISFDDDRLIHQTSTRVQSIYQISRVQSEIHFFHFSHLTNLRNFFIFQQFFILFTIVSSETLINSTEKTILSKKYFVNASSIVTRHFDYQSLQSLVQRNFDFLISILSRSQSNRITKKSAESSSDFTSQNLFNSTSASFKSNRKENSRNVITTQKKIISFIFFTTSFSKN